MSSSSSYWAITFSAASLSIVYYIYRKHKKSVDSTSILSGQAQSSLDSLDWLTVDVGSTPIPPPTPISPDGVHSLVRSLASLGMYPTSPRQSRRSSRVGRSNVGDHVHPATDNEDIADEVVHIRRISPDEEVEQYFSSFSQYREIS